MSSEQVQIPSLWRRIIDDAAVFPPGNAAIDDAIRAHARHRSAWYADCIGPLLLPVSGVDAACQVIADTGASVPHLALAVRPGAATIDEVGAAVATINALPATEVAAVEMALDPNEAQGQAAAALVKELSDVLPESAGIWVELRDTTGLQQAMRAIASSTRPAGAKFRMGGTEAEAFPDNATVMNVLGATAETGVTLKLTAGLHHAHRYEDPELKCTHHGFANVMLALHTLCEPGDTTEDARKILASTDTVAINEGLASLDESHVTRLRRHFASFGCCGVTDPIADLVDADLLDNPED